MTTSWSVSLTFRCAAIVAGFAVAETAATISKPAFVDVTEKAGLSRFRNLQGGDAGSKLHIVEVMGGGAAFLDFDKDGKLDVLLVAGSTVESYRKKGGNPVCALYRGDGKGNFVEVTKAAGLATSRGWAMGVAVADVDNDGWEDVLVTGYGRNFLFRNRGNGSFEEIAEKAGVAGQPGTWGMGAAFGDLDRDGNLDLYIANYLDYPLDNVPARDSSCNYLGYQVFCGPRGLPAQRDALYFGDGKGRFHDRTAELGIEPVKRYSLQPVIADYDNDNWPDIFVATDLNGNMLYHNTGKGRFEETGVLAGVAFSEDGVEEGSMGVDFGDLDNDGWLDLYYTNSSFQTNQLHHNSRDGAFSNITSTAGHATTTYLHVGWGTSYADIDNDGWEDLLVVNGHLYPEADKFKMGLEYKQRPLVFVNRHDRTFREAGLELSLVERWKSRGLAVGDYDNDGRLDILINNLDDAPILLHNEMPRAGQWLVVRCVGKQSNRSAVGARLTLKAGDLTLTREIKAGLSYLSSNDLRVHFGLGKHKKADSVEIRWPSGRVDRVQDVSANQILTVEESAAPNR
ncbi:MAG: CRTAC1 family protein [Bryobacteraceae bacterium]|nr:CRTAC1 family protein [Bryobacteraceae bacterium]